ncbi:unnamed protein product [Rotaria socialis]|uniref:Beta-lactamase-related domain-containing protein n=1 Tax=Rotaria socialis TaxID=392032 RepID=A0A820X5N6_9BILA|nr:unnamed protein product [Rotaria socialis]CAF4527942.1 unnamed protein product [Rotaria socialis]
MLLYYICIWSLLIIKSITKENVDFPIYGSTADGWHFVRELFQENFIEQRDLGASVAIYHQGKLVVDLWGGWFNDRKSEPFDNNTLQLVFSTSKGLVAVAVALCVQRGLLDYSALVTTYWPAYGQNGKENTTVADILSHRSGLPLDFSPFEHYLNWTTMVNKLEQQNPLWPPGTAHGYHTVTYGWLAGELVRRVDPKGRTLGEFIRDEIAKPLNIEFYIGLPPEEEHRVSPLYLQTNESQSSLDTYIAFNNPSAHQAEIPAANGITNARSVAKLYASLMSDVDDFKYKRLLNEQILKIAIKSNTPENEIDLTSQLPTQFGMGFLLMDQNFPPLAPGIFGHIGAGGSVGFAAPAKNFSFAYVMNRIETDIQSGIDARYKSMLIKIADALNNNNSSFQRRLSPYLFIFCSIVFLYQFPSSP